MKYLLILLVAPLAAAAWLDVCNPYWDLHVGFEGYFWRPCYNYIKYGEYVSGTTSEELMLSPEDEVGYRAYVFLEPRGSCHFVEFGWTYANGRTTATALNNRPGFQLRAFPYNQANDPFNADIIIARQRVKYDRVSLKFGRRFCDCLYGYFGGRWIYILVEQSFRVEANNVDWFNQYSGGGIEAGVVAQKEIWCGFGARVRMGGVALVGKRKHVFTQIPARKNRFVDTMCLGGFEVRGGITYTYACTYWWARGEFGYELNYYFNPLLHEQPTLQSVNVLPSNFGISGIFVGVTLGW